MIATYFAELAVLAVSAWFWLPILLVALILGAVIVNEKGGVSTFFTVVLGILVAAKFPSFLEFISDPIHIAIAFAGYVVGGVLWSRYKWSVFLNRKVEFYKSLRDGFLMAQKLPLDYFKNGEYDRTVFADYIDYLKQRCDYRLYLSGPYKSIAELNADLAPKASANKGSIVMWIAYWPIYVVWFIIADMVTELANAIYRAIGGHFQKMSDAKFAEM